MKITKQKLGVFLLAISLSFVFLVGCAKEDLDESPMVYDGVTLSDFRASDMGMVRQESYDFPYMGLSYTLPESLMQKMDEKSVFMFYDEMPRNNNESVGYAFFTWSQMDDEQRQTEVSPMTTQLDDWLDSLERIGTLGIYHVESIDKLDDLTGCTEHIEIGQSGDGTYKYFLSTNQEADESLISDVKQIVTEITEMVPYTGEGVFEAIKPDFTGSSIGEFETTDIHGKSYSEEIFSENDLTLVNIFATWCTPCVEEIPALQQLSETMSEKGVGVVGVIMDTVDLGVHNEEALQKSKILQERSGATFPLLMPDSTNMNGRLDYVYAYPETFFVDRNGNIVGEVYLGGRDLEGWTEIVEKELANLKGGN